MTRFNISARVAMFSICTSLEFDLKNVLLENQEIDFSSTMISKAKDRNKTLEMTNNNAILDELDLGDFVEIICKNPHKYNINNEKSNNLKKYFSAIIPIRNRVMHTRPLELGDRSLLYEVLEEIDKKISVINWKETTKTRLLLKEDPIKLISQQITSIKEYNSDVYHNLPQPEFDDTGYIGRKADINQIKNLINDDKNHVVTIIGNGGMGKTALAVKILYDLIDDPLNKYEAIIWISLKTKTLAKGEFKKIEDSIENVNDFFSKGEELIIKEEGLTPEEKRA